MLVLTREEWEDIIVTHAGERLRIRVCKFDRGKVRIGLDGPKSFAIHRGEVQDVIDELQTAADQLAATKEPAITP